MSKIFLCIIARGKLISKNKQFSPPKHCQFCDFMGEKKIKEKKKLTVRYCQFRRVSEFFIEFALPCFRTLYIAVAKDHFFCE